MKRFLLFALASTTGLIAGPQDRVEPLIPAPTQQLQESSVTSQESPARKSMEEKRIQAELETILEIRRQMGGGVAEALGSDFSMKLTPDGVRQDEIPPTVRVQKLDETFQKQLAEQLRAQQQDRLQQIRQQPQPDQSHSSFGPEPSPEMQISRLMDRDRQPRRHDPAELERRHQIREAARMLEQAAAILEEAGEYHQADSVRSSATKLWQSAR